MLEVSPIAAFKDNYIWMISRSSSPSQVIVVDPGEAMPVLKILKQQRLILAGILLTHHHYDHISGVEELLQHYTVPVYGPMHDNIPTVTHPVDDNDHVRINAVNLTLQVIAIPGHTLGHIAYYGEKMLFCGDTLFTAGCGRVFEGTPPQMYQSLQKLAALPDDTLIYCGHEYTAANLRFAQAVEPNNTDIQNRIKTTDLLRQQNLPTVPSTLALEKLTNPFLRCHLIIVHKSAEYYANQKLSQPTDVFKIIREWKNGF